MYKQIKADENISTYDVDDYYCYAALLLSNMGGSVNDQVQALESADKYFKRMGGSIFDGLAAYVEGYDNPVVWINDDLYFVTDLQRLERVTDEDVIDAFRYNFGYGEDY